MKKIILLALLALSFFPLHAAAMDRVINDEVLTNCQLSPNIGERPLYPGKDRVNQSNNLRRKTGLVQTAQGRFIKLIGRVVDESCVPIANAQVEIWQPNNSGYYSSEISKNSDEYDKYFNETGKDYTNNLGSFEFLSIYPGRHNTEAPHINIKIVHPDLEEFNSAVYFEDERKNEFDPFLYNMTRSEQGKYMAKKDIRAINSNPVEDTYYITITLKGRDKFRRY